MGLQLVSIPHTWDAPIYVVKILYVCSDSVAGARIFLGGYLD